MSLAAQGSSTGFTGRRGYFNTLTVCTVCSGNHARARRTRETGYLRGKVLLAWPNLLLKPAPQKWETFYLLVAIDSKRAGLLPQDLLVEGAYGRNSQTEEGIF